MPATTRCSLVATAAWASIKSRRTPACATHVEHPCDSLDMVHSRSTFVDRARLLSSCWLVGGVQRQPALLSSAELSEPLLSISHAALQSSCTAQWLLPCRSSRCPLRFIHQANGSNFCEALPVQDAELADARSSAVRGLCAAQHPRGTCCKEHIQYASVCSRARHQ